MSEDGESTALTREAVSKFAATFTEFTREAYKLIQSSSRFTALAAGGPRIDRASHDRNCRSRRRASSPRATPEARPAVVWTTRHQQNPYRWLLDRGDARANLHCAARPGVGALGQAAAIARAFPPAMLVIEDVDLVASERGMPGMGGSNPLLFQLLNEMDGLAPTDDVLFVLTTNRLDMLEPALAARPGRVDHAVEIDRPDAIGRDQLLRLYLGQAAAQLGELGNIVERTEGVTASFFKELVRRATVLAVEADDADLTVSHIDAALTELLDHATPVIKPCSVYERALGRATQYIQKLAGTQHTPWAVPPAEAGPPVAT